MFTTALALVLSAVGVLLAPVIVPLFAPGFAETQTSLAVRLTRLTMCGFVLSMLQYMLSAVLNSQKLFIGSQVSALLYNVVIIFITLSLGRDQSMEALTIAVNLGLLAQVLGLAACCRGHLHLSAPVKLFHRETWELLRLATPVLLGNSVVQINTIVDKVLSSMLPEGSLSALNYGSTLCQLVISVLVMSMSTVLYPSLTQFAAGGDMEKYSRSLERSLCGLTCVLMPISCVTVLSARDIVSTVYAHGNFDRTSVGYTTVVLACYAPMFVGTGVREVLIRAFYAVQDTATPMRNGVVGVACNIVLSIVLVQRLGVGGIALGTAISSFITAGLLLLAANRRLPSFGIMGCMIHWGKQMIAGAGSVIALLLCRHMEFISISVVRFSVCTFVGGGVYLAALTALDKRYIFQLLRMLKPRCDRENGE